MVTSVYGEHRRFVGAWLDSVRALDPPPDEVIVASDRPIDLHADVISIAVEPCQWKHPQAFYLDIAIRAARTEWVWIVDVDDLAVRDALEGLDEVAADVWQMGFHRSDGETYIPPSLTASEVLVQTGNQLVGSSAIRTEAYDRCGGFQDVAYQDWALWRALAYAGCTFESARKVGFLYMRHPNARGEVELTADRRAEHISELLALELTRAV